MGWTTIKSVPFFGNGAHISWLIGVFRWNMITPMQLELSFVMEFILLMEDLFSFAFEPHVFLKAVVELNTR